MIAIFWMFVLSHLIADYPLQTDWLVSVKRTWWGLSLHVSVHLAMLIILAGPALPTLWRYLLLLAAIHYLIDSFKNWLSRARPQWINGPYIFDQFLHLLSLIGVAFWVHANPAAEQSIAPFLLSTDWTAFLIGLFFCTVVWYISERVLSHSTPDYRLEVVARRWPRIGVRTLLFLLFLWLGKQAGLVALPLLLLPDPTPAYRNRAIVTDVAVALVSALLVFAAA